MFPHLTPAQDKILYPAPYGALTQLWAGTMPEAAKYNGEVRAQSVLLGAVLNRHGSSSSRGRASGSRTRTS